MQRNGPPLLLLLAALLVVAPSAHDAIQHPGDDKSSGEKVETADSTAVRQGEGEDPVRRTQTAKELSRLYEEFFGKSADSATVATSKAKRPEVRKVTMTSSDNQKTSWKFEVDTPEELPDPKKILTQGKIRTGCRPEFMIPLVPDPQDSTLANSFDQALSAIQMAFVDAGYLPDRFWLPWSGDTAKTKAYRTNPGILLCATSLP